MTYTGGNTWSPARVDALKRLKAAGLNLRNKRESRKSDPGLPALKPIETRGGRHETVLPPAPPRAMPALPPAPASKPVAFPRARTNVCAWPLWDDSTPADKRTCCGAPVPKDARQAYCDAHQKIANAGTRLAAEDDG